MRTIILAAFLLATLVVVPTAGAQTSGGTSTPTTTGDPKEVMMIGTIVSAANPDYLIIKTAAGNQKFEFKDKAMRPADLKPGTQVTMWVDEDDADDNPPGEKPESETYTIFRMTVADAASPPAPETPATPAPAASTPPPAEPAQPAPTTPAPATRDELPDTASPLTAVAIMGLLALIGAIGVRRRRHSM